MNLCDTETVLVSVMSDICHAGRDSRDTEVQKISVLVQFSSDQAAGLALRVMTNLVAIHLL